MSEAPLSLVWVDLFRGGACIKRGRLERAVALRLQGYLAQNKTPTPLGTPWDPRYADGRVLGGCIFV